jgi:hypothetical protein
MVENTNTPKHHDRHVSRTGQARNFFRPQYFSHVCADGVRRRGTRPITLLAVSNNEGTAVAPTSSLRRFRYLLGGLTRTSADSGSQ